MGGVSKGPHSHDDPLQLVSPEWALICCPCVFFLNVHGAVYITVEHM